MVVITLATVAVQVRQVIFPNLICLIVKPNLQVITELPPVAIGVMTPKNKQVCIGD